jgi:hypothetical protein
MEPTAEGLWGPETEEFYFNCLCGERIGGTCIVGVDAEFTCAYCGTVHTAAIPKEDHEVRRGLVG